MLEHDVAMVPDLRFEIELLVTEGDWIAACLAFDCHPAADVMGVPVDGRRVRFPDIGAGSRNGPQPADVMAAAFRAASPSEQTFR